MIAPCCDTVITGRFSFFANFRGKIKILRQTANSATRFEIPHPVENSGPYSWFSSVQVTCLPKTQQIRWFACVSLCVTHYKKVGWFLRAKAATAFSAS